MIIIRTNKFPLLCLWLPFNYYNWHHRNIPQLNWSDLMWKVLREGYTKISPIRCFLSDSLNLSLSFRYRDNIGEVTLLRRRPGRSRGTRGRKDWGLGPHVQIGILLSGPETVLKVWVSVPTPVVPDWSHPKSDKSTRRSSTTTQDRTRTRGEWKVGGKEELTDGAPGARGRNLHFHCRNTFYESTESVNIVQFEDIV